MLLKKTTLVYIIEKFPSSTEYFILNEIIQMEQNGFDIHLLILNKQKQYNVIPELKKLKATITYLPKIYYFLPIIPFLQLVILIFRKKSSIDLPPLQGFGSFIKIWRYYGIAYFFYQKKINPSHIHAHFAFIGIAIANILSKLKNVAYSASVHAQDIYTNQNKIQQHLPNLKFLITCTEYNKEYINAFTHGAYTEKIYRVYHGIKISKWAQNKNRCDPNHHKPIRILSVARLVEKKGLIYLLQAINRLVKEGVNIKCTIIGEGPLKSIFVKYIKLNKLQNAIQIIPLVSQHKLAEYYNWADIFILPCIIAKNGDRDGLPNVILEAMLSEVPIITTSVSAIPEIVKHKKTGLLVGEKDELAIADAIKLILNNNDLKADIIKNARNLISDHFEIKSCTQELTAIFNKKI